MEVPFRKGWRPAARATRAVTAALALSLAVHFAACAPINESATFDSSQQTQVLSASQVYRTVAPSIAFIEIPAGTGSGIFTRIGEDTYVVTNDHVVWPYSAARVVFPDGSEWLDVPVLQSDPLVDLAILGPLNASVDPISFGPNPAIEPGERVYLVGYPGEGELFPSPSISEGILARTRVWDSLDGLRFYQTDAAGAGGQSGGVLVAGDGSVIGISGLLFADEFVLAASTADLAGRLAAMAATGLEATTDSDRGPGIDKAGALENTSRRRYTGRLQSLWDTDGFLIDAPVDAEIEVEVDSNADLGLFLFDAYPEVLVSADSMIQGTEVISATVTNEGPQLVVVEQYSPGSSAYRLEGTHAMTPVPDGEDGTELTSETMINGTLDYPADIDWFVITLARGQSVRVTAEAIFDAVLAVGPLGATSDEYLEDDDSGRGMLGSNPALEFRATKAGDHIVVVRSYAPEDLGGYLLSVSETD